MQPVSIAFGAMLMCVAAGQAMAQVSPADRTFATKAAYGGHAEVALGQLATANAGTPQIRAFGERMVTDHSQANQALEEIGHRQDLNLPAGPDSSDLATEQRLREMKGQAFDAAYMHDMVQDHQQDIADFQHEAQDGKDPALRGFAQKYLPILQQHLRMAEAAEPK